MNRPRLLIADDHLLVVEGLRKLLDPEFEIVGVVDNGRSLLRLASVLKPDVILLDISMPGLNGIDAARWLKRRTPDVKLVFLTMHKDVSYVTEAFHAGASGYVSKDSVFSDLKKAIHEVVKGRSYITPQLADKLGGWTGGKLASDLTPRQREVLQLVAEGRSAKEIAVALDLSVKTVEFHKASIAQKLGIRTTAELTRYAIAHGIIHVG